MPLQIEERRIEPGITVIELAGTVALGPESQRIEALVDALLKRGDRKIVLDMTKVDHIDSAGIGLIALAAGKLKEAGGQCIVVAPAGRVLQLLNVTQMHMIVTVCPTAQAAAAAFA